MKVCVIVLDDVGWDLLETATTPRLDRIRANAKQFRRFVSAPNCSNFRAKLESGLYSPRTDNLTGGIYDKDATTALPDTPYSLGRCSALTSHVGKWHLCQHARYGHRSLHGYGHYAGSQANLSPGSYFDWFTVENGYPYQTQTYATDYVREHALVRISAGDDLVNIHFNVAHKPIHAPPGYSESSREAMLSYADDAIGDIHDAAIARGYLVVLTSDNGGGGGSGGKGTLGVDGIHTFLALSGPWPATRAHGAPVDATDLHATVWYELAGAVPAADGIPLHAAFSRAVAFADKFEGVGLPPGPDWQEMATDGKLKVIRRPATGAYVATDWEDDPTTEDVSHLLSALDSR